METTTNQVIFMKCIIFLLLIAASTIVLRAATGQELDICATCETELKLSSQEWQCLANDIDLYNSVPANPVLVSLYGCETKSKIEDATRNTQPDITIPTGNDAKNFVKEPYKRGFRLSKSQIGCLRKKMGDLLSSPPVLFNFSRDCKNIG